MSLLKKYLLSPDSVLGSGNYKDLDKTLVKLFPNFTSIPFDYLLTSWVTNYLSNRGFLTCLSWIVSIDRELHSLKRLEQKFGLSFRIFRQHTSKNPSHCTKNWIYTKFTQCKFGAKKCKLRVNKGQRW